MDNTQADDDDECILNPVRGILKSNLAPISRSESENEVIVTWDEEGIAAHDLTRGTRMKIEEPKTPYHRGSFSDHDEDGMSALEDTLERASKKLKIESAIQARLEKALEDDEQSMYWRLVHIPNVALSHFFFLCSCPG